MLIKIYIPQWTVDNIITNNMVTPCQKSARHVFIFSTDQYKKVAQAQFSTAGYVCSTETRVVSHPAVALSRGAYYFVDIFTFRFSSYFV